jgi:hypothetical protein
MGAGAEMQTGTHCAATGSGSLRLVEDRGVEPIPPNSTDVHNVNVRQTETAQRLATSRADADSSVRGEDKSATPSEHLPGAIQHLDYAHCRTTNLLPELARVVKVWPELPEPIRAAIAAMIESVVGAGR